MCGNNNMLLKIGQKCIIYHTRCTISYELGSTPKYYGSSQNLTELPRDLTEHPQAKLQPTPPSAKAVPVEEKGLTGLAGVRRQRLSNLNVKE